MPLLVRKEARGREAFFGSHFLRDFSRKKRRNNSFYAAAGTCSDKKTVFLFLERNSPVVI